jgi:hypothetical protein
MKYLLFIILSVLIAFVIWLPIILFTWDFNRTTNGWDEMLDGLEKLLNIS